MYIQTKQTNCLTLLMRFPRCESGVRTESLRDLIEKQLVTPFNNKNWYMYLHESWICMVNVNMNVPVTWILSFL